MGDRQSERGTDAPAEFWARVVAWLIDGLLLAFLSSAIVPVISFGFLLPFYWWADSFSREPDMVPFWFIGTGVLLWVLIWGVYFVGFWVRRGQTPGQMILRIRVRQSDGSAVSVEKALLRYLGYIVCGLFALIPFLWAAVDREGQGIPDKFADTVVVKAGETSPGTD